MSQAIRGKEQSFIGRAPFLDALGAVGLQRRLLWKVEECFWARLS